MVRRTNKLHLIGVKYRTVALIPAKDSFEAIIEYTTRTGFTVYPYLCSHLMANTVEFSTRVSDDWKTYLITVDTETIGGDILCISSQQIRSYNDIFDRMTPGDINNPLFVRPTIEEVRNCVGFSKTPMCKLRKFCI